MFIVVQLLKTKTGDEVYHKIEFLLELRGMPKNINVDKGLELIDFCEENNIYIWYNNPNQDNNNVIIEIEIKYLLINHTFKYSQLLN